MSEIQSQGFLIFAHCLLFAEEPDISRDLRIPYALTYNTAMDTVTHFIKDISSDSRRVLETLVGHPLAEDRQIVINVLGPEMAESETPPQLLEVPAWRKVYDGLSDEEVARIDQSIVRSHECRTFE